tara:strand:- start:41303 stop:41467 length:165 start_codon:yes stop_codon:yes gene_type:complete
MKNNKTFLQFCISLVGYKFINKKGAEVPKFILYWNGHRSDQLKYNRTEFEPMER